MTIEKHLLPVEEYKEPVEFANKQLQIETLRLIENQESANTAQRK